MIVLVMLLGAGIVYVLLQRLYRSYWNKNLDCTVEFARDHAVQGETIELVEQLTNRKALPLAYIDLKFQLDRKLSFSEVDGNSAVSDKTYRDDIFSLLFYQRITRRVPLKCTSRGVYSIEKAEVISSGAFLNEVSVAMYPVRTQIVVYPAVADVERLEVPYARAMGAIERNRHLYEDKFMFRGIREYESYDSMNSINWKASARTSELMVNQYNESMSRDVCILLDVEPEGMIRYSKLYEEGISIASGLAQMFLEQGVSVSLISNGVYSDTNEQMGIYSGSGFSHLNMINTALARIDLERDPEEFADILESYAADVQSESTLYIMISENKRRNLQEALNDLCGHISDAMWIVLYHNGMETALDYCDFEKTEWEVDM